MISIASHIWFGSPAWAYVGALVALLCLCRSMPDRATGLEGVHLRRQADLLKRVAHALAHEVRAPVLTIDGYSQILLESQKETQSVEISERIGNGVRLLQARLSAVIELCRIAGAEPDLTPVSLDELIKRVVQARCSSEAAPIEIELGALPTIQADPVLVEGAMLRLIDNAVNASRSSSPRRIGVTCSRDGDRWIIRVQNTGPEITETARRRLFEPFGIAHAGPPASIGMGLAIVREIAELHGGEAWHEPISGGSVFAFSIHDQTGRKDEGGQP